MTARNLVRHQPYLRREESKRLVQYCAERRTTESAVVREALTRFFADTATDTTLIVGRVDRVARGQARLQRDVELLSEAFALFVKFWFAHTPAIAEQHRGTARTSAEARYAQFVEYVSSQFSAGRRFLDDLPRDVVADDQELAAIVGGAPSPAAAQDAHGEAQDGK